jgi:uncharacterized membrane protein YeaQ/YmgE (transglycosylase-associated protein family)
MKEISLFLLIGAVAGWLAGQLMKRGGFGALGNIVVGCMGAVLGGFLFDLLGVSVKGGFADSLLTAMFGAIVLLFLIGFIKKE